MTNFDSRNESPPSLVPLIEPIDASWNDSERDIDCKRKHSIARSIQDSPLASLHLKAPVFLRTESICKVLKLESLPMEGQAKLASCVHRIGGGMLATAEDLASVPLREIPARIEPVYSDSMPKNDAILSADAIELQFGDWSLKASNSHSKTSLQSLRVVWPKDTPDLLRLAKKIELIRCLAQGAVPIGIALPLVYESEADLDGYRWLAEINIDFVTIRTAAACLTIQHPALKYIQSDPIVLTRLMRKLFDRPGKKMVGITIDHPWEDGYHAAQVILSGALLVGVGSYLAKFVPSIAESSNAGSLDSLASGLLGRSSIQSAPLQATLPSQVVTKLNLDSALGLFTDQLRSSLDYVP